MIKKLHFQEKKTRKYIHTRKRGQEMGVFLDTGFFVGLSHPKDEWHERSKENLLEMSTGKYGLIFTSPYVIAETATLILVRTKNNQEIIKKLYQYLYGTKRFVRILPWTAQIEKTTWKIFQEVNKKAKTSKSWLSFVDCSNIAFCRENNIETIATFDNHFDGFLQRLK